MVTLDLVVDGRWCLYRQRDAFQLLVGWFEIVSFGDGEYTNIYENVHLFFPFPEECQR